MTTTKNATEASVLAHHGIVAAVGQTLSDAALDAGLIYACLGCGSVGGTDPADGDLARMRTRDAILAADPYAFDCCEDADTIIY